MGSRGPASRVWLALTVAFAAAAAITAAGARATVFDLYAEDDARSRIRLANGDTQAQVDPGRPWALIPHVLPGPADTWAGGAPHALVLPLGRRPHRRLDLYLFIGNAGRSAPVAPQDIRGSTSPRGPTELAVTINDAPLTALEIREGGGSGSTDRASRVTRRRVEIPATALDNASNVRLALVNRSGPTVVLERIRLVEARPTFSRAHLARRGRLPPETAALLVLSLALLLIRNLAEATGRAGGARVLSLGAPPVALLLLGWAELMLPPHWTWTTAWPRWAWLTLPWMALLASRLSRGAPRAATVGPSARLGPGRSLPRRAAHVAVYLLGVILLLEGVSRGLLAIPGLQSRLANYDQDAWWRLQWIQRKRVDTSIYYSFDEYHPARGWALRANVRDARDFAGAVVNSNAMGVRSRREYRPSKPAGVTRVLVFGDSFTFGDEVSDDETYAAQLEQLLSRTEVINLGVHGYAHDQILLYLQEAAADYHPDLVLLGFVAPDMERNLLAFRDFAKPRFELVGTQLILRNTPVPRPEEVLAHERYRSRFVDLLSLLADEVESPSRAGEEDIRDRLTAAILDAFRQTVVRMGATPVFVYLPTREELEDRGVRTTPEEDFFLRYCLDRQIVAIDLRPTFLARLGEEIPSRPRGHWDPREHRIAAEAIAAALVDPRLVPRPVLVGGGRPPAQPGAPSS